MSAGMSAVSRRISDRRRGEAERRPERREDERLGQELAEQAPSGRAERGAHGELAGAALGAHEQQAGDVDAGDHQQQRRAPEQHEQQGTDVAGDRLGEGHERCALAAVRVRVLLLEVRGDRDDDWPSALSIDTPSLRRPTP